MGCRLVGLRGLSRGPIKMASRHPQATMESRSRVADSEAVRMFRIPGHRIALAFAFLDLSINRPLGIGLAALAIAHLCWRAVKCELRCALASAVLVSCAAALHVLLLASCLIASLWPIPSGIIRSDPGNLIYSILFIVFIVWLINNLFDFLVD